MEKIKANLIGGKIYSNSKEAYYLNQKSKFGEKKDDKVYYTSFEILYLLNNNRIQINSGKKILNEEELLKIFQKEDKEILIKYLVFNDLRKKGYIVKTGLKFGAEFRVYETNKDVEQGHSKWVLIIENESKKIDWKEFSSKNRVAHSINKNLLIAIVNKECDVLYYEIKWIKI
jgi:tRNA-intron endonuclease